MSAKHYVMGVVATLCWQGAAQAMVIPSPELDQTNISKPRLDTAIFAGGCFWGMEAVFEHVKGVKQVMSGYVGGSARDAQYERVSEGTSGHAESIRIRYDANVVTYGQLLRIFFSVAHNPTELNRQGPDTGTQYRSAIFFNTPEQQRIAQAYVLQLQNARVFNSPIVTQITPLTPFYVAEAYHQDYLIKHPDSAYIVHYDAPKLLDLKQSYPELYVARGVKEIRTK